MQRGQITIQTGTESPIHIDPNNLEPQNEIDEIDPYYNILREIPFTEDYLLQKNKVVELKITQNGILRIWIEVQIFTEIDENIASILIRKSRAMIIQNIHGQCNRVVYYVRCQDDTGTLCEDSCSNDHIPVIDFLKQIGHNEVNNSITIVKLIQKRAEIYIRELLVPNIDNYDLWLQWDDRGNVMLVGHLWPKQFEELNKYV